MSENKIKKVIREFGLTNLAVGNKTSIIILVLLIVGMGLSAYMTMPKENFPEINIPEVYIGIPYPGNGPADMENLVTRNIEKEIKTITGLDEVSSNSVQDYATISAKFDLNVDIDQAVLDVKDAVDRAELPNDLPTEPNIFKVDVSDMPVLNINISGYDNQEVLKEYAEYLQEEIEKISQVSEVEITGLQEKEVSINVDVFKMESRQISFGDLEGAIANENITMSGGDILDNDYNRSIRILGEFSSINEIKNIIVKSEDNNIVFLKDIAQVQMGYEDRTSYARGDLKPIVTLNIKKRSGQNLLYAVDGVKEIISEARKNKFPEQLEVQLVNDTSKQTRSMLSELENNIISGVILVVIVLLFFLGLRNALFVGIAIPLSMLMGIALLNIFGVTLNMMVLFSLILALGMLVDNGIVVVENIYRLMDEGLSAVDAAKQGAGEVAWPIIASTATTCAAFAPLLFWDDLMGEFMKYLPITLILVLSSSLFVALVVNPVLTAMYMKLDNAEEKTKWRNFILFILVFAVIGGLLYASGTKFLGALLIVIAGIGILNKFVLTPLSRLTRNYFLPLLEKVYSYVIKGALWKIIPLFVFIAGCIMFMASINIFSNAGLPILQFPDNEPNYVNVFIEYPVGTDIEKTNRLTKEIEQVVTETLEPYDYMMESILAQVGDGTSDPNSGFGAGGASTPNKARIQATFLEFKKRDGQSTMDIMEEMREAVKGYPGVVITLDKERNGPPVGSDISIEISGENFDELISVTNDVKGYLESFNISGVEELKTDLDLGKPELLLELDRDKIRRYGVSTGQVASTVRTAVFGKEISKYKEGEDEYPIMLRFDKEKRNDLSAVLNQKITFRNNQGRIQQIPIASLVKKNYTTTYSSVNRRDLDRVIKIYSSINSGFDKTGINNKYKKYMAAYDLPEGYDYKFTGEQEAQGESSAFLMRAFIIALALIFLILVSQFNSVFTPIIILISVAFSTIGVFLGYAFTERPFIVIMTGIGIISLAGIVVNNAIVLIDYINLLKKRRRNELAIDESVHLNSAQVKEIIIDAGKIRLRPVLLTAITTILGLIPLAVGININFYTLLTEFDPQFFLGGDNVAFWGPMAWAIIYGLLVATFLTLVMVPVMYYLVDRAVVFFSSLLTNKKVFKPIPAFDFTKP